VIFDTVLSCSRLFCAAATFAGILVSAAPQSCAQQQPLEVEVLPLYKGSRTTCWLSQAVIDEIGTALSVAQFGGKHRSAKPWRGEGPGVFEVIEDHRGDTYRAVYTVKFENAVHVLHAFQKKSTSGIKTARKDAELIGRRLNDARADYEVRYAKGKS
jgi:phage-related protein